MIPALLDKERKEALDLYVSLIRKWQPAINLVGPSTMGDIWGRHIEDSLALLPYLPQDAGAHVVDLGSGGGFPALVLAICRSDLSFSLIESDERKCVFLSLVSRETNCENVAVLNGRVESVLSQVAPVSCLTARALAGLDALLGMALLAPQAPSFFALFQKGRRAAEEVDVARARYGFDLDVLGASSEADSSILRVSNIAVRA